MKVGHRILGERKRQTAGTQRYRETLRDLPTEERQIYSERWVEKDTETGGGGESDANNRTKRWESVSLVCVDTDKRVEREGNIVKVDGKRCLVEGGNWTAHSSSSQC